MVALNGNFASDRKARIEQAESVQSEKSVDHPSSACLHRLRVENRFLFIGHNTDAYGNTLIYSGPGPDGIWFTDDDTGSGFTYGANDMIFCGYRYDPETRLYYVRNRMFLTDAGGISVGRWLQRDPIGYLGGVNLYEYVGGRAAVAVDPQGMLVVPGMPIPLPMHGAGPLQSSRGAIHDLGRGTDGRCRFYVNTYYRQDLGTILTNGWYPTGNSWQAYVAPSFDALSKFSEIGAMISLMLSGTTMNDTALYAYEVKVSFVKTRVFTYNCCKRYENTAWESTTVKAVRFSFWHLGSIKNANLNIVAAGSDESLINAIKEWDTRLLEYFLQETRA
jgi:RHS repeat-associated protein